MAKRNARKVWAGGFRSGESVIFCGRNASVLSEPPWPVPPGEVPIVFAGRNRKTEQKITVPADSLFRCYAGFRENQLVVYGRKTGQVVVHSDRAIISPGNVPVILNGDKKILVVPADDLDYCYSGFIEREPVLHKGKPAYVRAVPTCSFSANEVPIVYEGEPDDFYHLVLASEVRRRKMDGERRA